MKKLLSVIILISLMSLPTMVGATICSLPLSFKEKPVVTSQMDFNFSKFGHFMGTFQTENQGDNTIKSFLNDLGIDFDGYDKVEEGLSGLTTIVGYKCGSPVSNPYSSTYGTWELADGYASRYTLIKAGTSFTIWDYGELVSDGWWTTFGNYGKNGGMCKFHEISHLITFPSSNDSPAPVPEPATMLLFGTGLAGLIGASKMKKSKKK